MLKLGGWMVVAGLAICGIASIGHHSFNGLLNLLFLGAALLWGGIGVIFLAAVIGIVRGTSGPPLPRADEDRQGDRPQS